MQLTLQEGIQRVQELADQGNCPEGDCDKDSPYQKCPECCASQLLNEIGEILWGGYKELGINCFKTEGS